MSARATAVVIAISFMLFSSCSVVLAAKGSSEPDLSFVRVGATRAQIEEELGRPVDTAPALQGHSIDVYAYKSGVKPNSKRALTWAVIDVFTLFIWELVATPVELTRSPVRRIEIEYDADGVAVEVRRF